MSRSPLPSATSLDGDRLRLRPPQQSDRHGLLEMYADEKVRRHLGGTLSPRLATERVARHWLDPDLDLTGRYVLADPVSDELLGTLVLSRRLANRPGHVREGSTELEVSLVLRRAAWGRGHAERAVRLVLGAAAGELPDEPVVLVTAAANSHARRLASRLGFTEVDTFEEFGAEQVLATAPLHSFTRTRDQRAEPLADSLEPHASAPPAQGPGR